MYNFVTDHKLRLYKIVKQFGEGWSSLVLKTIYFGALVVINNTNFVLTMALAELNEDFYSDNCASNLMDVVFTGEVSIPC